MINRDSIDTLNDCLASVSALADEIIVVDTGSKDQSPDLARSYGARIIFTPWPHDYSAARNIYLKEAHYPWILSLDSDEILAKVDKANLNTLLIHSPRTAFQFSIRNYFILSEFDKKIGMNEVNSFPGNCLPGIGVTRSCTIRLFPNLPGVRYSYPVHESLMPTLRRMKMNIKFLDIPVHHFGFLRDNQAIKSKLISYQALGLKKITLFPGFYLGYFELGNLSLIENNLSEAAKLFSICIKLNPGFIPGHYQLGRLFMKLGEYEKAETTILKALKKYPGQENLNCLLAEIIKLKGNIKKA
jgi:glycosyltransferase involved in cell wall biosynthesis